MAALIPEATLDDAAATEARGIATRLVTALRAAPATGGVEQLVQEYALSTNEGVALMCLAEALLRIPDAGTRDDLIRDKVAGGDWWAHLGAARPVFVNAATWGLVMTGKLVGSIDERGLGAALTRLIARAGEPIIRRAVDLAMRLMGEQFVTGRTIDEALGRARVQEAKGFRYSYDMLGEAALTMADADRYMHDYRTAIAAIGAASAGRGIEAGPGISIKLSALHPRYSRAQLARVHDELLPRVKALCVLARAQNIGLNIDAEEADRLELSLDLLEALGERSRSGRLGRARLCRAGLWQALPDGDRLDRRPRAAVAAPDHGPAGQGRLLGCRNQTARRKPGWPITRSTRKRRIPMWRIWRARAGCWMHATRCSRNSPRTTRRLWPRSWRLPAPISSPAITNSSASTAWASRCTRM